MPGDPESTGRPRFGPLHAEKTRKELLKFSFSLPTLWHKSDPVYPIRRGGRTPTGGIAPTRQRGASLGSSRARAGNMSGRHDNRKRPPSPPRPRGRENGPRRGCMQCGSDEHYARECKEKDPVCFYCRGKGHKKVDCPSWDGGRDPTGRRSQDRRSQVRRRSPARRSPAPSISSGGSAVRKPATNAWMSGRGAVGATTSGSRTASESTEGASNMTSLGSTASKKRQRSAVEKSGLTPSEKAARTADAPPAKTIKFPFAQVVASRQVGITGEGKAEVSQELRQEIDDAYNLAILGLQEAGATMIPFVRQSATRTVGVVRGVLVWDVADEMTEHWVKAWIPKALKNTKLEAYDSKELDAFRMRKYTGLVQGGTAQTSDEILSRLIHLGISCIRLPGVVTLAQVYRTKAGGAIVTIGVDNEAAEALQEHDNQFMVGAAGTIKWIPADQKRETTVREAEKQQIEKNLEKLRERMSIISAEEQAAGDELVEAMMGVTPDAEDAQGSEAAEGDDEESVSVASGSTVAGGAAVAHLGEKEKGLSGKSTEIKRVEKVADSAVSKDGGDMEREDSPSTPMTHVDP